MHPSLKLFFAVGATVMGVTTTIHAYGLVIVSWPWLVLGTLAVLGLMALAQVE